MKRKILFFLFLFLPLHAAELIPQKVMLQLSKESLNYKMEFVLQKVVLSKSSSRKDIYIFSDDQTELSGYGISEVNAKILILITETENFYNLLLTDVSKETNLLITNITFKKGNFLNEVESIALKVVDILSLNFPPKEKKQLVTVETKKKKVSEFQKEKPTISVEAGFNFDRFKTTDFVISYYYYYNNQQHSIEKEPVYSFSPSFKAEFEYMWFLLSFTGKTSIAENYNYSLMLTPAIGLFGNLFFIGPFIKYDGGKIKSFETRLISYDGSYTNNLLIPDVEYFKLTSGIYFKFNVTKNYYFSMGFGVITLNSGLSIYLKESNITVPFTSGESPPDINMEFNFRAFKGLFLSLQFKFYEIAIKREWDSDKYPEPVEIGNAGGTIYLKNYRISSSLIGLGIKYEF